jgi:hypothetical protein
MSREILDILGLPERLVVAGGVERELADQLAVEVDHANLLVDDQQLDRTALVGPSEADFGEPAHVAQADLARLVDLVLADAEVAFAALADGLGLHAGAVGLQWRSSVQRAVGPDVVVVVAKAIELALWTSPASDDTYDLIFSVV